MIDPRSPEGPGPRPLAIGAVGSDAKAKRGPLGPRLLTLASALFLAAVLLFAGFDKLLHYGGFVRALESYVVVPGGAEPFLALPVILVEILLGVGVLLPAWRRRAAGGSALLLALFTVALLVNRRFAPEAPCGCTFTLTLGEGDGLHLALNLLLVAVAAGLALEAPGPPESPSSRPSTESTGAGAASSRSPGDPPDPRNELTSKEDP